MPSTISKSRRLLTSGRVLAANPELEDGLALCEELGVMKARHRLAGTLFGPAILPERETYGLGRIKGVRRGTRAYRDIVARRRLAQTGQAESAR